MSGHDSDIPDLEEILRSASDSEIISSVYGAVEDAYGYDRIVSWNEDVPLTCRVIGHVVSTSWYLLGEGYARLFNLKCNHEAFVECFRIVGLDGIADMVRSDIEVVGPEVLGDTDKIIEKYGSWNDFENFCSGSEDMFMEHEKEIRERIVAFIKENLSELRSIGPAVWHKLQARRNRAHSTSS
ncbi:hypothetical protein JIN85_15305 [Luteolibacter pohnpeiensis]|uniref:DUF4375 domain-containing protein n=1 Tax=Luteolibacter pohnpeiensis TaxID=454153 RepID=A0A934S9L9_9BACT|nr:hypothetical protein [Luteolibacter pohnpeiensis]MBK1883784.1 hypothetical protein [Luteolibacter pohnpeiensis]